MSGKGIALLMRVHPANLELACNEIPAEERKARVAALVSALDEMREVSPDPNDLLAALLSEEKLKALTEYPETYKCTYQLPFSKETIHIRMLQSRELEYGFDGTDWMKWGGDKEAVQRILRGKFSLGGPFYDNLCESFIARVFTEVHANGNWYFENLRK